jgi:two-component system cell cycle response regulator DivK
MINFNYAHRKGCPLVKKILVVEDDFDTRYVLSIILKAEGYEVVTAGDGEAALAVALEERPDLIVTDLFMPRLNGIDLTRKIRLQEEIGSVPIIAITGYSDATVERAKAAGASACARKPLAFAEFVSTVRSLLPA